MTRYPTPIFRNTFFISLILMLAFIVLFYEHINVPFIIRDGITAQHQVPFVSPKKGDERTVTDRLDLSEDECIARFPELSRDIDYAVKNGKLVLERDEGDYKGLVQGRIINNQVRCPQIVVNIPNLFY